MVMAGSHSQPHWVHGSTSCRMVSSLINGLFGFSPYWSWFSKAGASCHWTEYLGINSLRHANKQTSRRPHSPRHRLESAHCIPLDYALGAILPTLTRRFSFSAKTLRVFYNKFCKKYLFNANMLQNISPISKSVGVLLDFYKSHAIIATLRGARIKRSIFLISLHPYKSCSVSAAAQQRGDTDTCPLAP